MFCQSSAEVASKITNPLAFRGMASNAAKATRYQPASNWVTFGALGQAKPRKSLSFAWLAQRDIGPSSPWATKSMFNSGVSTSNFRTVGALQRRWVIDQTVVKVVFSFADFWDHQFSVATFTPQWKSHKFRPS